jgi:hypothetical protein
MMYQWGVPISRREAVLCSGRFVSNVEAYLMRRSKLMHRIEEEGIKQLKSQHPDCSRFERSTTSNAPENLSA